RCGEIERLPDFPWALHIARSNLQVAAGQGDADRITVDTVIRLSDGNVASATFQRDHKLYFIVHIFCQRRIKHKTPLPDEGNRRPCREKKRRAPLPPPPPALLP